MVSLARHFVPNPVSSNRTDRRLKCQCPLFLHTRYDALGRQIADEATPEGGSGVDDDVLRIDRAYEVRGMLEKVTSYDDTDLESATVLNQVKREYTGFAQLQTEWQQHDDEVDDNSPKVQYAYTDGSSGHIRLTKVTYPNGRYLHYLYDASDEDDRLNRVTDLSDDDGTGSPGDILWNCEWKRLGLDRIIQFQLSEPSLLFNLAHGTAEAYDGLDAFGRVKDLRWTDYGGTTKHVRINHGYDRSSNRTYREDPVAAANSKNFDELYTYDDVNRLVNLQRGDVNTAQQTVSSENFAQQWCLDATGNWMGFDQDDDGNGWNLEQTREHNDANELTGITGGGWIDPLHDKAGNMTTIPQPDDPTEDFDLTYDAWNRLVQVDDDGCPVAEYEYDGLNRRVLKRVYPDCDTSSSSGQSYETRHFYYSNNWQVLEERLDDSDAADRQYVWGVRFIDDLILRDRDADNDSQTGDLGKTGSGLDERLYALQDPNWNVIALFGESGGTWQVVERYAYDAYGKPKVLTPSFGTRNGSSYDWEYLYTGRRLDDETGLYYYRARYYDPELGRFIGRDPIGYAGGLGLYVYVGNTPTISVDPRGLQVLPQDDPARRCKLAKTKIEETEDVMINQTGIIDVGRIQVTVERQVIAGFLKKSKTAQGDWDTIDVTYHPVMQREVNYVIGYSGILRAVKRESNFNAFSKTDPAGCCCNFGKARLGFMAYTVVLRNTGGGGVYMLGSVRVDTPDKTLEHERWHTDGPTNDIVAIARSNNLTITVPDRRGYKHGGTEATRLVNVCLASARIDPVTNAGNRNNAFCERALNYCVTTFYMSDAVRDWIYDNGFWHDAAHRNWNTDAIAVFPAAPPYPW